MTEITHTARNFSNNSNIKKNSKKVAKTFEMRNDDFVPLQRQKGQPPTSRPTPPLPTWRELSYSFIEER